MHPAEPDWNLRVRARLHARRILPLGEALADHHVDQRAAVVDARVVVVACREHDAVLVLRGEAKSSLLRRKGVAIALDVLGDRRAGCSSLRIRSVSTYRLTLSTLPSRR
jgi:hypothetical protein